LKPLTWVPEAYPKSGGLAAAGFYKLLGRPRLDPLTVLVRETAQNSWDARLRREVVRFTVEGWTPMWSDELEVLRTVVLPSAGKTGTGLDRALARPTIDGLIIGDRGTRGLGGPLVADRVSSDDVYDWVDFVLNVGKPNLQGQSGGTYGFGKTITYIVSSVNAIVIHSRTVHQGKAQTRLIACAIGNEFKHLGRLHTGRHWWGQDSDGVPAPVTGGRADAVAAAIGMPAFEGDDLGTNILVLAPDFGGRTPEQAKNFLAESITWHLWPKLVSHGRNRRPPMDVALTWNGDAVDVPRPEERPPLHGFAQAFHALSDGVEEGRRPDGLERIVIRSLRPKVDVGDLVTVPLVTRPRAEVDDGHDPEQEDSPASSASIAGVCHHVALLRTPELVVDYLAGPAPSEGGTEWAAVFRCRPEVDGYFAAAEPPTHDSWRPELLEKSRGKTIVKVGLQRINEFLSSRWGTPIDAGGKVESTSTAIVADELAHIVRSSPGLGTGGGGGKEPSGGDGRGQRARVEILASSVALVDGEPATMARIMVTPQKGSMGTRLRISAGAALDETGSDPDLDPRLALLTATTGDRVHQLQGTTGELELPGTDVVELTVTVSRSADTAVSLAFQPEAIPV
jgi:hypothetical protein